MTTPPKTMAEIRDAESEKYADRITNTLESADARSRSFKAGFDFRDKLDNEALKIAVEALDKIRKDIRYAINNGQLGGPANFVLSSKEIDCDVALAEISKLNGEKK